jgi:putative intracellular protease/amidase
VHGPVYLVASGEGDVLVSIAKRALDGARTTVGNLKPRVAVTYAPVDGNRQGMKLMSGRMPKLFPGATIDPIETDRAVVDRADLVFISGGDATHGAKVLSKTGAGEWIREAAARGVPTFGVSAGAILLGDFWVDWPEDDDAPLEQAGLVPCLRVVAGHVFDAHDEADDWQELRAAGKLLAARGIQSRLMGIPTGGALVWTSAGGFEAVGTPPFSVP